MAGSQVTVQEIVPGIVCWDDNLYGFPWGLSTYLILGEKPALVDPGPTTSVPTVLSGIKAAGCKPEDISYIFTSHLHLDHVGGAGDLIKEMPQAKVVTHRRAIRHLIDPSRLIQSILEGPGEEWYLRDGPISPIAEDRLIQVDGGETFDLGKGFSLEVFYTPGHHPTSISFLEKKTGSLFPGDALGFFQTPKAHLPICPPPMFNLDEALNSVQTLLNLPVKIVMFPHFGVTRRVRGVMKQAYQNFKTAGRLIALAIKNNDPDMGKGRLLAWASRRLALIADRKGVHDFLRDEIIPMAAEGIWMFQNKKSRA